MNSNAPSCILKPGNTTTQRTSILRYIGLLRDDMVCAGQGRMMGHPLAESPAHTILRLHDDKLRPTEVRGF